MTHLEISLKSFEYSLISRATKQILEITGGSVFYFPLERNRFSILRSPHIDKKARDQFEILRYKNIIHLQYSGPISVFLEHLKTTPFAGIQMKIKISAFSYGPFPL